MLIQVIDMGKASTRAQNKYNAKTYDRITVLVPKGKRDAVKDAANAVGESLNAFAVKAIDERMVRLGGSQGDIMEYVPDEGEGAADGQA